MCHNPEVLWAGWSQRCVGLQFHQSLGHRALSLEDRPAQQPKTSTTTRQRCTCAQAFAIVLKGRMRAGRTRADPNDPTRYRFDAASALLHVRGIYLLLCLARHCCWSGVRKRAIAVRTDCGQPPALAAWFGPCLGEQVLTLKTPSLNLGANLTRAFPPARWWTRRRRSG